MSTVTPSDDKNPGTKPKVTVLLPLLLVVGLLVLLGVALRSGDPSKLPSTLIGKPIPLFSLPPLTINSNTASETTGLSSNSFNRGEISLLNIWASWCAPCQLEQPLLLNLAKRGIPIYSINYKDTTQAARQFLSRFGNPFRAIGMDENGMTAIDFGVYGVPETFVIDETGHIIYRVPGPLTKNTIENKIMPLVNSAKNLNKSINRQSNLR